MKVIRIYLVVVGAILGFFAMLFLNGPKPVSEPTDGPVADLPAVQTAPKREDGRTEFLSTTLFVPQDKEKSQQRVPKVTNYSVAARLPAWQPEFDQPEKQEKKGKKEKKEKAQKIVGGEVAEKDKVTKNGKERTKESLLESADVALEQGKAADAIVLFNAAIKLDRDNARAYMRRAQALARMDCFDLALADCGRALKLQPQSALHWEDRALLYFGKQKYAEAIADFDQAIERDPTNGMLYTDRALAHWAIGNKSKAQADFAQAEKWERTPEYNPLTWQGGLPPVPATRTLEEWNNQIQANAKDDQAYFGRGMVNFLLRCKLADAYEDFCKAIDLNPKVANYYHARGRILLLWQNQYEAIRDFDQAIKIGLNTAQVHNLRGAALKGVGKDEEASVAFSLARKAQNQLSTDARIAKTRTANESISGKPVARPGDSSAGSASAKANSAPAVPAWLPKDSAPPKQGGNATSTVQGGGPYFPAPPLVEGSRSKTSTDSVAANRSPAAARVTTSETDRLKTEGQALLVSRRFAEAVQTLTRSIDLDPNDGEACDQRGLAHLFRADYASAEKDFATAIWLDPRKASYHAHRGMALYYGQRLHESLGSFEAAHANDPSDPAHLNYLGMARLALSDADGADREFTRALAINQKDARALNNRASARRMLNRLDEAVTDYTSAIACDPKMAEFLINRGSAYCIQRKHDQAIVDFSRAIEIDPNIAEAYAGRAISYRALGMDQNADQDSERVARMNVPVFR